MDIREVFERAMFVTYEEKDQLEQEGYELTVVDVINNYVYRVHMQDEDYIDVQMGLSFMRSVTKGYGNIHLMDLFSANPSTIITREVTYKDLIKLHHKALESELKFAGCYEDGKLKVHYKDDYLTTVLRVLN